MNDSPPHATNGEQPGADDLDRSTLRDAVSRLSTLGSMAQPWSVNVWRQLRQWLQEDGLSTQTALHGGCRYLLVKVAAARPAFGAGHRQALLISARFEPDRVATADECTPAGVAIARGGLLVVQALALAKTLQRRQQAGSCESGRDLFVSIEIDERHLSELPTEATDEPIVDALAQSAFVVAEWGGWPMDTGKSLATPIAIAQKGRLLLQLRTRGEATDPALPGEPGAIDQLRDALAAVDAMDRPWRKTDATRAFVSAMAELSGLGRGVGWLALLGGGAWKRALDRVPQPNRRLLRALFHDTITPLSLHAVEEAAMAAPTAIATLDCRLLPVTDQEQFLTTLRRSVGDKVEVTVLRNRPAVAANVHTPLFRSLCEVAKMAAPDSKPVPILMVGSCDALGWRQSAVPCYGFAPLRLPAQQDALQLWETGKLSPSQEQVAWGIETMMAFGVSFCVSG